MFDFSEMMKQAQGGQAMLNLARHFGITPDQSAKVIEAMMPAFVAAIQRQMSDPAAGLKLMQALFQQAPARNPYLDALAAFQPETKTKGEELLALFFGSGEVAKAITEHVAKVTGLGQQMLASMMPVIASMTAGGLAETPFAKMMAPFLSAGGTTGMPDFSAMFSGKAAEAGATEMMKLWQGAMPGFEPAKFEAMLKDTPNPAGPGTPFGDLMGEFFKGYHKTDKPQAAPDQAADFMSQMFQAGKDAQASQVQAFEDIIDKFWGGKPARKRPTK